jgi:hypothetical protein
VGGRALNDAPGPEIAGRLSAQLRNCDAGSAGAEALTRPSDRPLTVPICNEPTIGALTFQTGLTERAICDGPLRRALRSAQSETSARVLEMLFAVRKHRPA